MLVLCQHSDDGVLIGIEIAIEIGVMTRQHKPDRTLVTCQHSDDGVLIGIEIAIGIGVMTRQHKPDRTLVVASWVNI